MNQAQSGLCTVWCIQERLVKCLGKLSIVGSTNPTLFRIKACRFSRQILVPQVESIAPVSKSLKEPVIIFTLLQLGQIFHRAPVSPLNKQSHMITISHTRKGNIQSLPGQTKSCFWVLRKRENQPPYRPTLCLIEQRTV